MKKIIIVILVIISTLSINCKEIIDINKIPKHIEKKLKKEFDNNKMLINLSLSISYKETRFKNLINKTNREHSVGYFQLNMNTVDYINSKFGYMESVSVSDLKNSIDLQVFLFSRYLEYLVKKYDNNLDKVLRVYNGGANGWKNTKNEYVEEILYNYELLANR